MGKEIVSNRISLKDFKGIASIGIGGTGDNTAKEARDSLRIIGRADHNTMNGVAGLDEYGMLKDEQIPEDLFSSGHALNGPKQIVAGSTTNVYRVTYWSDFRDIQVTIDNNDASIYLDGNGQVVIDAPSTPGIMMLTITGSYNDEIYCNKSFPIDVVANTDHVNTPGVVSPVTGAANLGPNVTFTSSSFGVSGGSDTHEGSDWQLAADADFTSIVASVTNSASDKTSWTVTGLPPATQYYVRTRYKGTSMGYSNWCVTSGFTTKASYQPTTEEAILVGNGTVSGDLLGDSVTIDQTGTRVAVGCARRSEGGFTRCGAVYIFIRSGNSWTQEAKLTASDKSSDANFGKSISMSGDGTRIVVGAPYAADLDGNSGGGKAYVYLRTGTTWSQETVNAFGGSNRVADKHFGYSVSISSDGHRIAIGAPGYKEGFNSWPGAVHIFFRSGSWTEEAFLLASDRVSNDKFGYSVTISSGGELVYVGSPDATNGGAVYAFTRPNSIWIQKAKLLASDRVNGDVFGRSLACGDNGRYAIIGADGRDSGGITNSGAAYIFYTTDNVNWSQQRILTASDKDTEDAFGYSVSITEAGDKCIVGAYVAKPDTIQQAVGALYLYVRTGTTWSQVARIIGSDSNLGNSLLLGTSVAISNDGTRIASGGPGRPISGYGSGGAAYIYS